MTISLLPDRLSKSVGIPIADVFETEAAERYAGLQGEVQAFAAVDACFFGNCCRNTSEPVVSGSEKSLANCASLVTKVRHCASEQSKVHPGKVSVLVWSVVNVIQNQGEVDGAPSTFSQ